MTPERVLNLISDNEIELDFFFMDEIYKVDNFFDAMDNGEEAIEDDRDIVFRIVLYILSKMANDFYLAGPYIKKTNLGQGLVRFLDMNSVEFIEIKNELIKKVHISAWATRAKVKNEYLRFGNIGKQNKLLSILNYIRENRLGPTIVYASTKNKVTEIAKYYSGNLKSIERADRIKIFIEHLRKRYSISKDGKNTYNYWSIVDFLSKGVATHYGSYPKYIQNEILELFNSGLIENLFVTTSITEGVNTKAKNLVFYGSKKGVKELSGFDIRNINGRAGRYYHHFVGRVFYLEREIFRKLENDDNLLDLKTFSDDQLPNVDLDNTELDDLFGQNKDRKKQREEQFEKYGIDSGVFVKNRLVDKEKQLQLILLLRGLEKNDLQKLVSSCCNIRNFLIDQAIYSILEFFYNVGLLDEFSVRKYGKIASEYANYNGFFRLLIYHLKEKELSSEVVDKAYNTVFDDIRSIVEYKIPKFLSIFETLLKFVCAENGIDTERLAFDSIIRFFELGVNTDVGLFLAEAGFPISALKVLENNAREIMGLELSEFVRSLDHFDNVLRQHLDEFEIKLLRKILQ